MTVGSPVYAVSFGELQRALGGRLEIVGRFELIPPFLHKHEAWMRVGEIMFPTWRKNGCNGICPNLQIRQPANGPLSDVDRIERPGC
jgi:hypothetical protein